MGFRHFTKLLIVCCVLVLIVHFGLAKHRCSDEDGDYSDEAEGEVKHSKKHPFVDGDYKNSKDRNPYNHKRKSKHSDRRHIDPNHSHDHPRTSEPSKNKHSHEEGEQDDDDNHGYDGTSLKDNEPPSSKNKSSPAKNSKKNKPAEEPWRSHLSKARPPDDSNDDAGDSDSSDSKETETSDKHHNHSKRAQDLPKSPLKKNQPHQEHVEQNKRQSDDSADRYHDYSPYRNAESNEYDDDDDDDDADQDRGELSRDTHSYPREGKHSGNDKDGDRKADNSSPKLSTFLSKDKSPRKVKHEQKDKDATKRRDKVTSSKNDLAPLNGSDRKYVKKNNTSIMKLHGTSNEEEEISEETYDEENETSDEIFSNENESSDEISNDEPRPVKGKTRTSPKRNKNNRPIVYHVSLQPSSSEGDFTNKQDENKDEERKDSDEKLRAQKIPSSKNDEKEPNSKSSRDNEEYENHHSKRKSSPSEKKLSKTKKRKGVNEIDDDDADAGTYKNAEGDNDELDDDYKPNVQASSVGKKVNPSKSHSSKDSDENDENDFEGYPFVENMPSKNNTSFERSDNDGIGDEGKESTKNGRNDDDVETFAQQKPESSAEKPSKTRDPDEEHNEGDEDKSSVEKSHSLAEEEKEKDDAEGNDSSNNDNNRKQHSPKLLLSTLAAVQSTSREEKTPKTETKGYRPKVGTPMDFPMDHKHGWNSAEDNDYSDGEEPAEDESAGEPKPPWDDDNPMQVMFMDGPHRPGRPRTNLEHYEDDDETNSYGGGYDNNDPERPRLSNSHNQEWNRQRSPWIHVRSYKNKHVLSSVNQYVVEELPQVLDTLKVDPWTFYIQNCEINSETLETPGRVCKCYDKDLTASVGLVGLSQLLNQGNRRTTQISCTLQGCQIDGIIIPGSLWFEVGTLDNQYEVLLIRPVRVNITLTISRKRKGRRGEVLHYFVRRQHLAKVMHQVCQAVDDKLVRGLSQVFEDSVMGTSKRCYSIFSSMSSTSMSEKKSNLPKLWPKRDSSEKIAKSNFNMNIREDDYDYENDADAMI